MLLGGVSGRVFAQFSGRVLPGFAGKDSGEVLPRFLGTASGRFSPKLIGEFSGRFLPEDSGKFFSNASPQLFPLFSGHASAMFRRRLDFAPQQNILEPPWEPLFPQWWLTSSSGVGRQNGPKVISLATARSSCPLTAKKNNSVPRHRHLPRSLFAGKPILDLVNL